MRKKRVWLAWLAVILVLGAGAAAAWRINHVRAADTLPTAPVRKGDFSVIVRCRGELKAGRSVQIVAPLNVPELRIIWLAPSGSAVKAGDPVVRFDPSSAKQQLDEKEAALKQAQAALDQAVAEARIAAEQDQRALADARYQVERAQLQVSKMEILSVLQGEEAKVELGIARSKLASQEASMALNKASNEAKIASLTRQRDKARDEVNLTQERLSKMELHAPIEGIIVYHANFSQGWMNAKPFKVGDQVWPGGAVGEIPDLNTLEMEGKIEEIDRGRISLEQEVRVRIDSLPEAPFPAQLRRLSPMTEMGWEWPPKRTFRGFATIQKPDTRLRPGMNGGMDVVVSRIPNALSVPSKALFTRNGRPIVYLAREGRYDPFEVNVLARNPDEVALDGIPEGSQVALAEPGKQGARKS